MGFQAFVNQQKALLFFPVCKSTPLKGEIVNLYKS